jgi:hypothetical protein
MRYTISNIRAVADRFVADALALANPVTRAILDTDPLSRPQRDPRPDQLAAAIKRAHDDAILYGHTGYPGDAADRHRVHGKPW